MRCKILAAVWICFMATGLPAFAAKIAINSDNVITINSTRKVFPIGVTLPPPPTAMTPSGVNAFQELHSAGVLFMRTGIASSWDPSGIATEKQYEDAAAKYGLFCQPWLRNLAEANDAATTAQLKTVINTFKSHPGLGMWKGSDEPFWGKKSPTTLTAIYKTIKSLDPDHPVWIVQAPRGTSADLIPYNTTNDISGIDIYPVSYPPGSHSVGTNKEISMVGDFTDTIMSAVGGKKPVMMTLQIAWSGVTPPGKRLRFADFAQERFMAFQAIIHGARGLQFFGGNIAATLSPSDAKLGWNWTYWNSVLRPLCLQIGDASPLKSALVAAKSKLPVKASGSGIEFTVREVGSNDLYILACKREGSTIQATFSGLPTAFVNGEVLYESPAVVKASGGSFTDWFGPFDVHVYHFHK